MMGAEGGLSQRKLMIFSGMARATAALPRGVTGCRTGDLPACYMECAEAITWSW